MAAIHIGIKNLSSNDLPVYATAGAAGLDIRAMLDMPIILESMQRFAVPTGIYLQIPDGYEAQVRPRSGMALKYGITCLNTPGTIDSDYRGEIKVILINLSTEAQTICHGDRIAQMVFQKVETIQWQLLEDLTTSARGEGGFGHTGKL